MAELSLSNGQWRILRLALRKKRFRFEDTRTMARHDRRDFDWLGANGFFAAAGEGWFEMTDLGRESSDLGYYQWTPPPPSVFAERKRGKK